MKTQRRLLQLLPLLALLSNARADQGGVSFWLPGQFGSLAAAQAEPGFSLGLVAYHSSTDGSGADITKTGLRIVAGLEGDANLVFIAPTYTFEKPLLDAQAALSLVAAAGNIRAKISATIDPISGIPVSAYESDSLTSYSDLYPLFTLKWNKGVHNFLAYTMADVPIGSYDKNRLANIGIGHWAVDVGGGYTYLDKQGEFSAVLGFSYNFENPDTDYKNGIDAHLELAVTKFITPSTLAGLVGYFYNQITGDSGSGATLGDHKSRVAGIGPQVGHFFTLAGKPAYLNLKAYYEFAERNRAAGWNIFLSVSLPIGGSSSKK